MTCPGCGKKRHPASMAVWTRRDGLMVRYEVCGECVGTLQAGGVVRNELTEKIEAVLEAGSEVIH
jgi:hypothetical protein